jgi:prolyl oligopeptidase
MRYPDARRVDIVDDLHGHLVADPYRWLEATDDPEVVAWLEAQAKLYGDEMAGWGERAGLRAALEALMPGAVGSPLARGDRLFFSRRLRGEDQASWFVREAGSDRLLLDPAGLSSDGTVIVQWALPSVDGGLLAYAVDEGGRESLTVRRIDVATGDAVDNPLELGRGGAIAWLPDGGLIVVATLPGLSAEEEQFHRRVWHIPPGGDRDDAAVLFGEGRDRTTYYGVVVSRDGLWLLVSCALGTAPRNDLYLCDLTTPDRVFVPVIEGADAQTHGGFLADGRLVLETTLDAPKGRLVVADANAPGPEGWTDLVAERDDVLDGWAFTDTALFVGWQRDVASAITIHDRGTGREVGELGLPGLGTAGMVSRPGGTGDDLWISYTDNLTPPQVLHHRPSSGATTVWADAPGAPPPSSGLEVVREMVTSTDGTRIPLFVARPAGLALDGTAPTILYGYGGFNVSMAPAYSALQRAWVEGGGVYAIANLRGGGEYGEAWHRDGMRAVKQHVFDDFGACADWLIASGHTSPAHLAVSGGSNGGLLVGAALTQLPEKITAVHCSAPLLDMVRYELWGLGITWNDEYGTAADPEELGWLLGYSPYHRVVDGTAYPAVLFSTFGGDTRVDPLHARKMCARLQHATSSDRPVLLRHEENVGHGARTVGRTLDTSAEVHAFLAAQIGWPTR